MLQTSMIATGAILAVHLLSVHSALSPFSSHQISLQHDQDNPKILCIVHRDDPSPIIYPPNLVKMVLIS